MGRDSSGDAHHRRADVQGLRAIAVLAVVLHHAWPSALPGGFAGVDVFFVLSGFLITGILVREMDQGRFSLTGFYKRRVRRLFPALFVVLAFTLIAGVVLLSPSALKELALTQFFTNLFLSNLAFVRISGYFDPDASLRPLLHTWSLGVEEQFYLLFPPLLLLLHRFARRWIWFALLILAFVSLNEAQAYLAVKPVKAFYHPFSRAMELLIGALCVGMVRHVRLGGGAQHALSGLGLAAIAASLWGLGPATPFPGLWALLPCLGTAAMLVASQGAANRLISNRPMTWVGDMSYSLYLWHWPLLVYGHMVWGVTPGATAAAVVLAFALAWASRKYVEEPWLSPAPPPTWWPAAAATAASIAVCVVIYVMDGLPQRFGPAERALFAAVEDHNPDRDRCHKRSNGELPYADTCVYGAPGAAASVVVWADSVGAELSPVLGRALAPSGGAVRTITASGCPAGRAGDGEGNCGAHRAQVLAGLRRDPAAATVILMTDWSGYDAQPAARMPDTLFEAAEELKAAGKRVILILPLPSFPYDPPSEAGIASRLGRDPSAVGLSRADYARVNDPVRARILAFAARSGVEVFDPVPRLCGPDLCPIHRPGVGVLYFDGVHLSLTGAGLLVPDLVRTLEAAPGR